MCDEFSDTILDDMLRTDIRQFLYVGALVLHRHTVHFGVLVAIDERSIRLNEVDELRELVTVDVERREDIDMVPLDAGDDGHVGFI